MPPHLLQDFGVGEREFELAAPREIERINPDRRAVAPFHLVERAAHLVRDDRRAGGNGVNDAGPHQFGDERGDPFMNVRARSR